jgi:hypothetical protein
VSPTLGVLWGGPGPAVSWRAGERRLSFIGPARSSYRGAVLTVGGLPWWSARVVWVGQRRL